MVCLHGVLVASLITVSIAGAMGVGVGGTVSPHGRAVLPWVILLGALVGCTTSVFGGRHLHSLVCGGLRRQQRKFSEVADTLDLSKRSASPRPDEFGKCAMEFDRFMRRIDEAIRTVQLSVATASVATQQIAAGNTDLSSRTEKQAASLEETAANVRRITDAVSQNASHARHAHTLAESATHTADSGNNTVQALVISMGDMRRSAARICEIITVIEGIAFQTNILALNAAVESARAGERGRGFTVVAGEVRTLAQRTSVAAKEIETLIQTTTAAIEASAERAADAGRAINEVQRKMTQVAGVVGEISAECEAQRDGVQRIDLAVSQIDDATQQNAALVEQAAAATQSLSDQMHQVGQVVDVFTLSASE